MSVDVLTEDDALLFFEDCLREEGLEPFDVAISGQAFESNILVRKQITRDEYACHQVSLDIIDKKPAIIRTELAQLAETVSREFEEMLTETYTWSGRCVKLSLYDGTWARCDLCDTEVDAPNASHIVSSPRDLSTPQPTHRDMNYVLDDLTDYQELLLKLYLMGRLREQCDHDCPNSKYTESFI